MTIPQGIAAFRKHLVRCIDPEEPRLSPAFKRQLLENRQGFYRLWERMDQIEDELCRPLVRTPSVSN